MFQDISKTLEKILYEQGKLNRSDVDIAFDQPNSEWAARLNRPTINCWCFDVRENLVLRTGGMVVEKNATHAQTSFTPRRMDITYLISAWAREIEDEHNLLWRALSTLKRMPHWIPSECVDSLRYQTRNMPILVADMSEAPYNLSDLWSVMDNRMKLGFIFRVTVELELDILSEPPLVLKATINVAQSKQPADRMADAPDVTIIIPKPTEPNGAQTETEKKV